mgnify:CR=1 FL=1
MFVVLGILTVVGGLAFLPAPDAAPLTDPHMRVDHEGLATNRAHPYWLEQTPECPSGSDVYCTAPGTDEVL